MDYRKYHLLYIDDEESNLRIFRTSFKRRYTVHVAPSGSEGLKILDEQPIDLILTDQKMPEMTGVEFLKKAIEKHPNPFRIIVTGFSDTESIIQAINECGIYHYITKPWKNEEMRFIIDKALEAYQMKMNNDSLMNQLQEANQDLEKKVIARTEELQESKNKIEQQHRKMQASINYALRIQNAMLPHASLFNNYFDESFVMFQPRDVISGDFYWLDQTKEGHPLLALADCTGHGVPGAFMTLIGNELLNSIFNTEEVATPNDMLVRLHKQIVRTLRQDENNDIKDGMDIAICHIDPDQKKLYFAGGKNGLVIIRNGELTEVKGDRHSVGGSRRDNNQPFTLHEIDTSEPANYYLFTDGYIDQFGGPDSRKFMRGRFKDLLQEIQGETLARQGDILKEKLAEWKGHIPQIDDISVIGFKI